MSQLNKLGIFGSCQLEVSNFFLTPQILKDHNIQIKFYLPFFEYDPKYPLSATKTLDNHVFDDIDTLIIENNKLDGLASSEKIIEYCLKINPRIKIIRTALLKFPIFPINWSGYGENSTDYQYLKEQIQSHFPDSPNSLQLTKEVLDQIDFKSRFQKCIHSLRKSFEETNLDMEIVDFIETNFSDRLLFTHSLHPTNILLFELWKSILKQLDIDINQYQEEYDLQSKELILCWENPPTTKMIQDLNITHHPPPKSDDQFYINRFKSFQHHYT